MKIVMFSMTPLFPDTAMGGAQVQLKKVALHLGALGHQVTILCTRKNADHPPFTWHENVRVEPILRFKQPYPEPYFTPIYNIANAIQEVADYLDDADVHYSHDGGLIFPYVYQDVPTVISLRSILFAETLQSAFLFNAGSLIVPSDFVKRSLVATVGRFFPDLQKRTQVINNGFRWDIFQPTDPTALKEAIPELDPDRYRYLLFPHRPEAGKGFADCIALVDRLVHEHGIDDIRVLVPQWLPDAQSPDDQAFYRQIRAQITAKRLDDYFVFHGWIPESLLPAYYSVATLALVIGSYVETFGNVAFEALGCGTPVIISRVGPSRTLIDDAYINKIDYGDTRAATQHALRILRGEDTFSVEATRAYLQEKYHITTMVEAFADKILNATVAQPMPYQRTPLKEATDFAPTPWCFVAGQGVYHDFRAEYTDDPVLMLLFKNYQAGISRIDLKALGISDEVLMAYLRDGYLYPLS
ncbi:MAG: glycosyltransferase family 4 protein [Chloroflexota bacterium]